MTAVYLIRHPQTTWNVEERYQGRLDARLSKEGWRQAALLAKAFTGCPIDVVYSSPLSRALDLARALAAASDAPLRVDNRLTEIGMGTWEGLRRHEIEALYTDQFDAWYSTPEQVTFTRGESLADVRARSLSFLEDVMPAGLSDVIAVTHSAVVQAMAVLALDLDPRYVHRIPVSNASVTTLLGTAAPGRLLTLNDTEPLYHSPVAAAEASQRTRRTKEA